MTSDRQDQAALLLAQIDALGLTLDDLQRVRDHRTVGTGPTVRAYVEHARRIYTDRNRATAATYEPGWRTLVRVHGHRPISELTTSQLERVLLAVRTRAICRERARVDRRRARGRTAEAGNAAGAEHNALAAIRAVFKRAEGDGELPRGNPAAHLTPAAKNANRRRALTAEEVSQIYEVATTTGDDPHLDALIVRTTLETGARRDGLVNLRLQDLNARRQTITLHEKNGKSREQPVTAELFAQLQQLAASRGAIKPHDAVLRYRRRGDTCAPLTERRFDTLFERRVQRRLVWAEAEGVTLHWLRHTAGTRIERVAGRGVARSFLGHASADTTDLYTTAQPAEVIHAWCAAFGASHPLNDAAT